MDLENEACADCGSRNCPIPVTRTVKTEKGGFIYTASYCPCRGGYLNSGEKVTGEELDSRRAAELNSNQV